MTDSILTRVRVLRLKLGLRLLYAFICHKVILPLMEILPLILIEDRKGDTYLLKGRNESPFLYYGKLYFIKFLYYTTI